MPAESGQRPLHVCGKGRQKIHNLLAARMPQPQSVCMQCLPRNERRFDVAILLNYRIALQLGFRKRISSSPLSAEQNTKFLRT